MSRTSLVVAAVLVFAALFTAPFACGATQQDTELKQVKAELKSALATSKTNVALALAAFDTALQQLQSDIETNTVTAAQLPGVLVDTVNTGLGGVEQAQSQVIVNAATAVGTAMTVPPSNATMPGGGGEFDKFRGKLDAERTKSVKKVAGAVKKFAQGVPKLTSGAVAVNATVFPMTPVFGMAADDDSVQVASEPPVNILAVAASSAGVVAVGGGLFNGESVRVTINATTFTATGSSRNWRSSLGTFSQGSVIGVTVRDSTDGALIGFQAIGIPTP